VCVLNLVLVHAHAVGGLFALPPRAGSRGSSEGGAAPEDPAVELQPRRGSDQRCRPSSPRPQPQSEDEQRRGGGEDDGGKYFMLEAPVLER
jgi:hypothetical protein